MFLQPVGFLIKQGSGGEGSGVGGATLPLYGLKELPLVKEVSMEFEPVAMSTGNLSAWNGDRPIKFELSWSITAGLQQAVQTRQDLYDYLKKVQSWAAPSEVKGEMLLPPPRVMLIIPGYISCSGVVERASCTPRGPWDFSGVRLPTSCDFQISFLPIKNYNVSDNVVDVRKQTRTSDEVEGMFYMGG